MPVPKLVVIGGGAAGFFGAITAAEQGLDEILILEKGPEVLTKVRISGGGRCNVTHDCLDAKKLTEFYPRGHRSLIGPFHRWSVEDTIAWFKKHGVTLKTESDGRMFPVTDDSQTIIDALTQAAHLGNIRWRTHCGVTAIRSQKDHDFEIDTSTHETIKADAILVATGGTRMKHARIPAEELEHSLLPAIPSLFTFKIDDPRLTDLPGVSVPHATIQVGKLSSSGPMLITHWGLSGPAILKLSAWGARELAENNYHFTLQVNWLGNLNSDQVRTVFNKERMHHGARKIFNNYCPFEGMTRRLWQRLCEQSHITNDDTWAKLTKAQTNRLLENITAAKFQVEGKSINKDEFVTCGGVPLKDVHLKTMESKHQAGLFFAGEILDIDGITGGFNFQAAWTTGRLAGLAIQERLGAGT